MTTNGLNIIGTANNDILNGTSQNDTISGLGGNDTLLGGDGYDSLNGGNDNDVLTGGVGRDTLDGGSGDDFLVGEGGARLFGLTDGNMLVSFDPNNPRQARSIQVTGINGNLIGIDFRPQNGMLYGVTDTGKIYIINASTGVASNEQTISPIPFNAGQTSGVDFNPIPNLLRLVGANDQNIRVNVDNGQVADGDPNTAGIQADGTLMYDANDPNSGVDPNITAAAYTNSVPPSPRTGQTTLYEIDSHLDTLVTQGTANFPAGGANAVSPNTGRLFTVGSLGVDFGPNVGFDIFSVANPANYNNSVNIAYAVTGSSLYGIDLSTGAATSLGQVGNGSFNLIGLAATTISDRGSSESLQGGDGNDSLLGGRDSDSLNGGRDNDYLWGGSGRDTLSGEQGNDVLDGGLSNDSLWGGDDHDTLLGGQANDLLDGDSGNDSLWGGDGRDTLFGDQGNDFLDGGKHQDNLDGGHDDDTLIGGVSIDNLDGGSGNDLLYGDGGSRLFGLAVGNTLVSFDADRPDQTMSLQVTGVNGNLIGIDFRPQNGMLYGVTDANKIYIIDVNTGVASNEQTISPIPFNAGVASGVDFNPIPDRLRLVGANDQNLRVNVDNGLVVDGDPNTAGIQPDGTLMYDASDPNSGINPNITGAAYTNSVAPSPRTGQTTLYEIDSNLDMLVTQGTANFPAGGANAVSPNTGRLFTVGSLGVDFGANTGFDIFSLANPTDLNNSVNIAYAVTNSTLYSINLSTGAATNLGIVGNGSLNLIGLAATTAQESTRSAKDRLIGGVGNDILVGGIGNDTLTGGTEMDSFSFSSPMEGVDTITDFSVVDDTILVSALGFGGGLVAGSAITADQFVIGSLAIDAADRFVYNSMNGQLFFDMDGVGGAAQVQIASLTTGLGLTNNDIFVVA